MSRTPFFGVLVAFVLVASVLAAAGPAAPQAAMNGRIVFVSGRTGTLKMFTVDTTSGATSAFAHGPAGSIDADPAWEPFGSRIAFSRSGAGDETYDLLVRQVGGPGGAVRITDDIVGVWTDRQPAWSPTADRIAFTRLTRAADTSNIYAVNVDGTGLVQLTSSPAGSYDASPAWSSDGSRIAFVSNRTGFPQIWSMDAAGGGQSQVTFGACFVANPSWEPASNEVVFEQLCPGSPTGWDLAKVDSALPGSLTTPLTFTAENDHQPAWSPDGMQIAFTRYGGDGNKDLYRMAADGSTGPTLLTGGVAQADMSPDWEALPLTRGASPTGTVPRGERLAEAEPLSASAPLAAAAPKKQKKRRQIPKKVIKGVRYRQMRRFKSDVYVLKVNPKRIPRIDASLAKDLLPGHERTRNMAKRHQAVAAINGDFGTPSGRPSHTFAEDGDLKQVSFAVAPTFAMTQDEKTTHFSRPFETVTARETDIWPVDRWNFRQPGFTDVAGFTPAVGALDVPPANACSARLQAVSGQRWAPGVAGVEVDFHVAEVGCATVGFGPPAPGQVVLSGHPGSDAAILLNSLSLGETVTLTWSIGFPGVLDTVGGIPLLLENGVIAVPRPCTTSICKRHPRTAIGVTPTGRILMVVVDGRRKDSKGVTLVRLARVMQGLNASFAMNLDGGGSSTMVVRGRKGGLKVVNRPSGGRQRKVSSAVLILKGKDKGESIGGPLAAPLQPAPPPTTDRAGEIAAMDPASTGGLAEALARGTFGPRLDLPPDLRRALRIFRSAD